MSVLISRRLPVFSRCCLLVLVVATLGAAQKPPTVQIQDEEFARLVKEWTTKPEFSSPLVDHLPKSTTIPSPKDVLGNHMGEPKKMLYYADALKYYRAVAAKTPRVKVLTVGKTHEGRENVVVIVGSDESMKNLEQYRLYLGQLADPRNLSDAEARAIVAKAKPIYHMIGGVHSPESAAPLMFLELVYRLVVEDSPIINQIRDNVIVSITPSGEPDGMDRFADWVNAHRMNETSDSDPSVGSPPYWGKYTYHDDNRDINVSQPNMKNLLDWYLQWHPPIVHDMHQSIEFLYTYSGQAPQNPTFDPIIFGEMPWMANFEMAQMTKYGMPGVWTHAMMDAYGIGYFSSFSPTHNGLLRMYETFGNGSANTVKRNVGAGGQYGGGREWYRPVPASTYGIVDYSMRNSINYCETAVLSALQLTAAFPKVILENFYQKSRNSIEAGKKDAPFGYVIPGGQRDTTRVAFVIGLLRQQGIEVGRATSEVKLKEGTFPAGSFIVKRDQPYGRLVKMLLEKQIYPDPKLQTYDDSGWTVGLMTETDIKEIADKAILDVAVQPVAEYKPAGTVAGASGSVMAVAHYGSNYMVALRYRLKDLKVQAVEQAFQAGGLNFPAGSFLISLGQGDAQARAKAAVEELGLTAAVMASAPSAPSHDVDLPRLAVYSTWGNTQEVGWVRHALDYFGVTYDLIFKERVKAGNLRSAYDVIIVPNQGRSGKGLVYDIAPIGRPIPYKKTEQFKNLGMYGETDDVTGGMGLQGAAEFQKFAEDGGLLTTFSGASTFPAEFGITRTIEAARPTPAFYAPGPIVQAEILKPLHPIFYGYTDKMIPVRYANGPLLTVPERNRSEQILMRFPGGEKSVLSGFMRNPDETLNRPAIVEVPTGKGRVVLFATNPCYRWQVWGEFNMMFNLVLNFNDIKPAVTAAAADMAAAR